MAANLTVYKTHCDICPSTFNTTTALMRHRDSKHRTEAEPITSLPFYIGQQVLRLPPSIRTGPRSSSYKQWVTGIVDSMNSCLHPKAAGKWCRVERFHVPEKYVQAMLADMPNSFINSAREKRHFRPPVWREKAKVYHYRDYEVDDLISALGQQSAEPLKLKRSYLGDKEVLTRNEPQNARQALQEAKERARSKTIMTPSIQIEIVVGHGEGRTTREFEVIWWPDLFSGTGYGKLTLRFYVSKVLL